jgi:hypothetical protein
VYCATASHVSSRVFTNIEEKGHRAGLDSEVSMNGLGKYGIEVLGLGGLVGGECRAWAAVRWQANVEFTLIVMIIWAHAKRSQIQGTLSLGHTKFSTTYISIRRSLPVAASIPPQCHSELSSRISESHMCRQGGDEYELLLKPTKPISIIPWRLHSSSQSIS